jgi:virulence factor Mce-like protein
VTRVLVTAVLVAAGVALAAATTSTPGSGGYTLRAVFDNGSGLRTGMDVRVSGIDVGRVRAIELDQSVPTIPRAVAVIRLTDRRAANMRNDARCQIRSATLLGDRFVDCQPTQKRRPGTPLPPPLPTVEAGGQKQHLLPVSRTSSPVDPDLMLDIFRLPVRQRLSIVINELGAGLAGNGGALREAIRRADPAFLQLDRTLKILRQQRRALAHMAESSDKVLAPLARERQRLAGFVVHGNELLGSVAQRREALRETFRRMPAFLRELRPTMGELKGLAAQAGPALDDLDAAGRQLSNATRALEPAAREGTVGLRALGRAAGAQSSGLREARPVFKELARLARASRPVWTDLQRFLGSLRQSGGFERLVEAPMAVGLTSNGFDQYGYYSRANAVITTCTSYTIKRTSSCVGTFEAGTKATASSAASDDALLDFLFAKDAR